MDVIKKNDSDFKCLKCSKVFKHKMSLAKHSLSHKPRREWPIKCIFCEEFFQVSLLLQQQKNHNTESTITNAGELLEFFWPEVNT